MIHANSLLRSPPLSSSAERLAADLTPILRELKAICGHKGADLEDVLTATESLLRLRHTFIDNDHPRAAKDAFRHLLGFQTLLDLISKVSGIYDAEGLSRDERRSLLTLCKDALGVLAESLKEHFGNKRYFAKRIAGGGSLVLENALAHLARETHSVDGDREHFYGSILAAALCQETIADVFSTLSTKMQHRGDDNVSPTDVRSALDRSLGAAEIVEVPELLGLFLRLWLAQPSLLPRGCPLTLAIPACLCQLASQSQRNVAALNATGMLSSILPLLFSGDRPEPERALYQELARVLCTQGMSNVDDAVTLYREAHDRPEVLRFLLDAFKCSKEPPFIHFDMSLHGYSSVEFSTLGRSFPPVSSSGYTLAVWARFDQFDPDTHSTIFGAFDASQTCFLLAYLEKETRHFILQTSIRGSRPSVRFKSMAFEPNRWYHICVIHKRPKSTGSSRASLFIDGEFVEQLKIDYPAAPLANPQNRTPRVQAFFGTPQDLAMRLGKGVSSSRWSLGSGILFEETYSDDMVSVFYNLGPRYFGNFQDCLGSFQTYKASAALNLRNEHLHPDKEEDTDIITAIRRKASVLIHESSILINICPAGVLDDDDNNNVDESQLVKSLSKQAAKNLNQLTKSGGNAVAVNGATPAINGALTQAHGVGILTGDPVVAVPQSLDDASWRIGGCAAVQLSLIQAASTAESLLLSVEILYEAVQDSWRNSEAMERENGYGILAALLREKLGFPHEKPTASSKTPVVVSNGQERSDLAVQLLRLTLKFVGYDFENPRRSIITNPLAYRVLLVDLDIWRVGELPLLQLYYSQFAVFAAESQFRRFNSKRLSRMRVNKKLLECLKGEEFTQEALQLLINAFRSLMDSCLSTELLRSLALFITYSLHKQKPSPALQKKKSIRFLKGPQQPLDSGANPGKHVPSSTVAIAMLRMYCSYLLQAHDLTPIKKFARAVTNKWLLYLMCEDEPEVVVLAAKILARLIVIHGSIYSKKFGDKNGGYVIMQRRLKRWTHVPVLWPICLSILFGLDVGLLNFHGPFDPSVLFEVMSSRSKVTVVFPEVLPVITAMMQSGLKKAVLETDGLGSEENSRQLLQNLLYQVTRPSMSSSSPVGKPIEGAAILITVVDFFTMMHAKSSGFRDFATQSIYVQELLSVLFPVAVGSDIVSPDAELNFRDGTLSLDDKNLVIRPRSSPATVLRTTTVEGSGIPDERGGSLRRGSSFILVSSDKAKYLPSPACIRHSIHTDPSGNGTMTENPIVKSVLELILIVFSDQLLQRKDFSGLGLYLKTPPSFPEHQTFFESWVFRSFLAKLRGISSSDKQLLLESRVLTNLGRFATHIGEALYEGWFVDGAIPTLDFLGTILEFLQQPEISSLKIIRLCSQSIVTIQTTIFRVALLRLSEIDDTEALLFLKRLTYWQAVLLSTSEAHSEYLQLLCYLLYTRLISDHEAVRPAAASLWRVILVQKPAEMSAILAHASTSLQQRLSGSFEMLVGMDDAAFLEWVDDQRDDLDALFFGSLSKVWESFVQGENSKTEDSARVRGTKRKEKLKVWNQSEMFEEEVMRKHDVTFQRWVANISASEFLKHQRALQDQQDNAAFMWSAFSNLSMDLRRFGGVLADKKERKWRLDQTEGRSRMRRRIVPDESGEQQDYQPKRKASEPPAIKIDTQLQPLPSSETASITPVAMTAEPGEQNPQGGVVDADTKSVLDESFEMVDDPKADFEDYEDKNRKVMRSLHRGDQVQSVCNVSRIIGLEANEGLLILGKDSIYILDNFFQRADGEIVNVWQAPSEERDPYVRMIAGREANVRRSHEHETRSWKWLDLVSVSKRRFLFRDVALEVFFTDGTSYLLTLISSRVRDDLCNQLASKAPQVTGSTIHSRPEDIWRFEMLRSQDDAPQSLGSKFASVFGHSPANPATRKWVRGEMSNFHYLMLVNTLAGRTFNDLTQYPVFPWVLADYTSEELDLTNPKTFRDLSKPMGCQTPEREAELRERYNSFAEMGDDNFPPFHYGTHYSSAMIVCSYLIRLQPFVKSYLLLQGGTFDHADRLFYSVANAWESASRGNMTDVRELIPEFFYLPEFLVNSNRYDFGLLQNMTKVIDSVELPPWAKGDPKIFITKHREALESPYVTQNLHHWIDLVFGCKQKGEAAVEAVNVFHHLSYQGAKDVDNIDDPMERMATIGIIHNFGQTPYQIFNRSHPSREEQQYKTPRLDYLAESLTQVPISLLDTKEKVSSLSMKQDRLLCAAALRLNIPPNYDRYMEWGFSDGSVRFYSADSRKLLGHFEHLHIGQLSCAIFADSRTLITTGTDCTISTWTYTFTSKFVDLQPTGSLFGHRTPVTVLAVSRAFSTLLSASTDGQILLWDLNRQSFVRELPAEGPVECARINEVTGDVMVCRGNRLTMYTLNGDVLLDQVVCEAADDHVLCCIFYEGSGDEWLERELVLTGHRRGLVNIWSKTVRQGRFELDLIRQLHHVDHQRDNGANIAVGISCILALPTVVYTGDEAGRVYEWNCVQRH
ncbi:hypothetical protein ASPZODRAFT_62592 [Penicilliopsis zonata CBS 506.65]|uniref:Uncharacterized protein n=1 Tax=Penicilliopsis zonata CBS 506.65 TaxID=1073090 RepID=A0A1L9SMQ8_9EURO|nr:hypothetical protein ASPZODRAFT_62592 [Penicilliopsis zonata CBS 506.65]OJJ48396.1 hypothetical protein ASPZODRAFT_62592 [Penicilliopsis zonata CBS 506.65]